MFDAPARERRQPIKLIPLIDVILFVLLYFFIVGHLENHEPNAVNVPEARSGHVLEQGQLTIVMSRDGKVMIGEEVIPLEKVQERVSTALQEESDTVITLKADAALDARIMVDVLQAVKRAGGVQVSLVTQRAEATP